MSVTGISANRLELLQIADAVAREKSIDKEIVIEAIEEAYQKAARARYGAEHDIRVKVDTKTGETTFKRYVTVIEDDTEEVNEYAQLRLTDAKKDDKAAVVGKVYEEILPPFEIGRVQTQMARQVVTGKVIWVCTRPDRKSTRLNSSHTVISYAVFCLKKKKRK